MSQVVFTPSYLLWRRRARGLGGRPRREPGVVTAPDPRGSEAAAAWRGSSASAPRPGRRRRYGVGTTDVATATYPVPQASWASSGRTRCCREDEVRLLFVIGSPSPSCMAPTAGDIGGCGATITTAASIRRRTPRGEGPRLPPLSGIRAERRARGTTKSPDVSAPSTVRNR